MKHRILKTFISLITCASLLAGCGGCGQHKSAEAEIFDESTEEPTPDPEPSEEPTGDPLMELQDVEFDYVTIEDIDPQVRIPIDAPANYTAEDVLQGITLENVSSPIYTSGEPDLIDPDLLIAEGGNGQFEIFEEGGFKKGDVYQITLTDTALTFTEYEDHIRVFNLTTTHEDVFNAHLSPDLLYINSADLSEEDAEEVKLFDGLLGYNSENGLFTENNRGIGSFTAEANLYNPGDVAAVYEGVIPTERKLEDSEHGVAYVEITDVQILSDGTAEYTYQSADQKDVLFIPDIIPVQEDAAFTDGNGEKTFDHKDLIFSSDSDFAKMGLDENTQIDVGDYLAFYEGSHTDGEVTAYAKITDVSFSETEDADTVTLKYTEASLDEILSSTDIYRETELTEAQIRSAYNEEEVKAGILSDMNDNGLLSASTYELAESVLDTEDVKNAFGDTPVEDLNFYFGEDESISLTGKEFAAMAEGDSSMLGKVIIDGDADVMISPNIVHFAGKTGYGTGIRAEAFSKYVVTIKPDDPTAKTALKINLVFYFEVEIVMGLTIDATTVWKTAWIFPYVYDYSITGKYADGLYIGAGFTTVATLIKNEKEKTEEEKMAGLEWPDKEIEKTPGPERIMKLAEFVQASGKKHDKIFPAQDTGGGSLAQKYKAFAYAANNKDWVDIIDKELFDWNGSVDPFHIIAYRLKGDLVVSTELHVAIGVACNYEVAVIDTFNYLLFHEGKANAKHMNNNGHSMFRLDEYLFGVTGIKAGLRIKIMVGLLDARLDSLGFELEGGLYARMWGFIYGGIEIQDIGKSYAKDHVYFAGGFLADAGAYGTVTFVAEMANGQISYRRTIISEEYPFFQIGTPNVTLDYAYEKDDESKNFSAEFSKRHLTCKIPKDIAMMSAMDLKSGEVSNVSKGDESLLKNFDIQFDDEAFSYMYQNNEHYLVMDYDKRDPSGEGDVTMTLTWKGSSFELDTDKLERKIKIHWVCDMTSIKFLNKDNSIFYTITKPAGAAIQSDEYPSATPEAYGYTFKGWRLSGGPRTPAELPTVMPSETTSYEGLWEKNHASVNVTYLLPYDKNEYGNYSYREDGTDVISGIYYPEDSIEDIVAELSAKGLIRTDSYPHTVINYHDSVVSCDSVAADGSTTFKIALNPESVPIEFILGDGQSQTQNFDYGSAIEFPQIVRDDAYILGWMDASGQIIKGATPAIAVTAAAYTAVWAEKPTTITVVAQVKQKSGFSYMWRTIKTVTLPVEGDQVTVAELIDQLALEGYTFDPNNSAYTTDSVITPTPYTDNKVTLRFK